MSQQPDYLLGIHNFKGRTEDELDILRGDYIEVIEDDSAFKDSWYIGRNLNTNATGLFPKAFTTAVASLPAEVQQRVDTLDSQPAVGSGMPSAAPTPQQASPAVASPAAQQQTQNLADPSYTQQYADPRQAVPERSAQQPPAQSLAQMTLSRQASDAVPSGSPNSTGSLTPQAALSRGSSGSAASSQRIPSGGMPYRQPSQSSQPTSDIDAAINEMSSDAPAPLPAASVLSWTPQNVEAYFMAKGFVEDAPKFVQHRITGPILLELDRETLKEIDIVSFGPRFSIDKEVRFLRQLVGMAQSPAQDSPQSPLSTAGSQTYSPITPNSVQQTPQMGAQGFFPYGNQSYTGFNHQAGSSVTTLSAQVQPSVQPSMAQPEFGAEPDNSRYAPQHYRPPPQTAHPQPPQFHQPHLQNQQFQQPQRAPNQQFPPPQPPPEQFETARRPSGSSPYSSDLQKSAALPIPGARPSQSQSGSEEEITGSLGSNFSARPPSSAAALAAAQAAQLNSQGGRGHHRHTSSATSRYSVVPSQGHSRKRTLDDWESGLEPAVMEQSGPGSVPSAPSGVLSHAGHARNTSNMSNLSSFRSSMPSVPSVPIGSTTPSTVSSAAFEAKPRKHNRSASESAKSTRSAMSTDSKKQSRRSSVLSLLPGSPKIPKSPKKANGTNQANGNAAKLESQKRGSNGNANALAEANGGNAAGAGAPNGKRTSSENTFKALMRPNLTKQKTSAFQEGIKNVTAEQASATASKSGWMHKRGGSGIGVWVKRFFTLHGTRLSYFSSFKDGKERGLIDITGHRVLPVKDHELLVSLSAAGMGAGRFCFKLVPPGPGYKKGVAFTAPKVHYFAVESEKEMREWQSALMSATIERDESQPVLSTSQTPTISLPRAQELMAARLAEKGDIGSLSGFAT